MINIVKIAFWSLIPLVLLFSGFLTEKQRTFIEVKHTISIKHPGEVYAIEATLIEVQNEGGFPIEYHMDVESVICLADVCKVIPVTLYWDNIGKYQKYILQKGATLEKYEADLFEANDYRKLHGILENMKSPFKDVFIEDIWNVPSAQNQDTDAISGATILELDERETVQGAALTCYTLWHWANGNIVSVIKNITNKSVSNEQLKGFILSENETYCKMGFNELKTRNLYDESYVNVVVKKVLNDNNLLKEAFSYLEKCPPDIYLNASSKLFFEGEKEHRLSVISSLKNTHLDIPISYFESFSSEIEQLESFQEISALLELIQNRNLNSSIVNNNVIPLLDSYFIVARRAYWFLSNQELTSSQEKKLQDFKKENKERL